MCLDKSLLLLSGGFIPCVLEYIYHQTKTKTQSNNGYIVAFSSGSTSDII